MGAYYDILGVSPTATADEIRSAYRALARRHHPDAVAAAGGSAPPGADMAAINRAWSVLGDPGRRAMYDASLRNGVDEAPRAGRATVSTPSAANQTYVRPNPTPPRFPWRFVLALVVLGTVAILIIGALTDPAGPAPIDNLIQPGSCVDIDDQRQEAFEVPCSGSHEAVVARLVPFDARCAPGEQGFRDRQGMGQVCAVVSER
ncbi:MAG: hypothetical protein B7C54_06905 [Acidimicrobiales bacterium mtb01]|nr:J domain-containing protein [Actinomycetota bacterium]TEX44874.1 MAG: hypothetical protein B7C54_06905 [Acidimicrobiales bacterium mtb01]